MAPSRTNRSPHLLEADSERRRATNKRNGNFAGPDGRRRRSEQCLPSLLPDQCHPDRAEQHRAGRREDHGAGAGHRLSARTGLIGEQSRSFCGRGDRGRLRLEADTIQTVPPGIRVAWRQGAVAISKWRHTEQLERSMADCTRSLRRAAVIPKVPVNRSRSTPRGYVQGVERYVSIPEIRDHDGMRARRPSPCLLYTSPSPRDRTRSRMPSSA